MTQTETTRWGPVEAVYGRCDCGRYGWKREEGEHHVLDCASRTVVAFTRKRPCETCGNRVGVIVHEEAGEYEMCEPCVGTGRVSETMTVERYREIVVACVRFALADDLNDPAGMYSPEERAFALAIHESGVLR